MGLRKPTAVGVPLTSQPQPDRSKGRAPQRQMQLQFTQDAPALPENLAAGYSSPRPIVIEKLPQLDARRDPGAGDALDPRSSVEFSVVSEEKLNLAVQLAKRDVKRRHLEEQVRQHLSRRDVKPVTCPLGRESATVPVKSYLKYRCQRGNSSKAEMTRSGAKVFLYTPSRVKSEPSLSDSPPTHDPGPGPVPAAPLRKEEDKSTLEVKRLQKELQNYVQKIEALAKKERSEEMLDPDEERRARVRRQEQAVRSARMLYVLQQQVKEIQEDLEKLSPHKIRHTKKSRARARLAAAQRGAIRALQVFAAHVADQSEQQPVPAHSKELGSLIRQLSLCSALLEGDSSSSSNSVPDVVIDLLLQIEDLDSLVSKKESPKRGQKGLSTSQAASTMDTSRLPKREKKVPALEPKKPAVARRLLSDERLESEEALALPKRKSACDSTAWEGLPPPEQEEMGQAKWEVLGHPRPGGAPPPLQKRGVLFSTRPQVNSRPSKTKAVQPQAKQTRFREPTIAFRLKETKPPVRESRTPWVPPSLASPLSSPQRHMEKSPRGRESVPGRETAAREGKRATPGKDEGLRADDDPSATEMAEKVERAVWECLEPLLAKAQKVNLSLERDRGPKEPLGDNQVPLLDAGQAATGVPGEGVEDSAVAQQKEMERDALFALGTSNLETLLQRMEEIERSQEAVRRRYHRIVYSDTEFWAQEEKWGTGQEPGVPHPIQITKQESRKEPHVDIVLGRPLDTNVEDSGTEGLLEAQQASSGHIPPQKEVGILLSVPKNMLQSIRDYGARYEQHLKCLSHEEVGSFNPWQITERLAEELMEGALAEVAAELQGLCEDYAEAVFTSEFLQAPE